MKSPRTRRDALAGDGPIVDRARAALKHTAAQFGTVTETAKTSVTVRTADGIALTLSYTPGNYIFSRVYNLKVSAVLPPATQIPSSLELNFTDKAGARFQMKKAGGGPRPTPGPRLTALNARIGAQLRAIDLIEAEVDGRTLNIVPMGGSYVWVLIPPVFKATAFPSGEVERIIDLVRSLRDPHVTDTPARAA